MKAFHRVWMWVSCSVMCCVMLSSTALAAYTSGPTSYDAAGTEQPSDGTDYSVPIDSALKDELDHSTVNPEAIAKKNAYFENETDRIAGILKTDIAMLGDLPANGVDVMFISDVSGSMNLFSVDIADESAYTCSCCNEEHYYRIKAGFKRNNGSQSIINSGKDIYFKLSDFATTENVGYSLVGVGWDYMPWRKMFMDLQAKHPNQLTWYDDLDNLIIPFVNLWNPTDNHYRLTGKDSSGQPIYEKIVRMGTPAGQPTTASYYSPDAAYRATWGCKDRMNIAREWIGTFSERILNYSVHSHIGLVDFAGNYAKPTAVGGKYPSNFTSDLSEVNAFLSATAGYDNTHYHLGLNAAADAIEEHYSGGCNHQLFVVFISDGMPDYGQGASVLQNAETNVRAAIDKLHTQINTIRANPSILEPGKGAEIYAAGICVSKEATWPPNTSSTQNPPQTAEYWLKQITGDNTGKYYENCSSIADFEAFMSGIRDAAAKAITGVMTDKLGAEFSFICSPQHPITLWDYYNETTQTFTDINNLPPYIRVDQVNKTISLDIEQLKIYKKGSTTELAGMRLDFYTQMSARALAGGAAGTVSTYPTNTGNATLTYLDADNDEHIVNMPPPYVTVPGTGTYAPPQTGDSFNAPLLIALAVISLCGAVTLSLGRERRLRR